ncbi:unannotated protein [freshwater metagenome]|uniref:Unannotated protein n=1 Tax=freshwater metagenome TaxID=449393 RepID=A0A6J7J0N1_9ZZZZ
MKVVEPSPSKETTLASTAVPTTSRTGLLPTMRRIPRINGSNRPTSIMSPK